MITHANDHARKQAARAASQVQATLGYTLGVNRDVRPAEPVGFPGGYRASRKTPEQRRMAGDALNLDLKQSLGTPKYVPLPVVGSAELRTPGLPQ